MTPELSHGSPTPRDGPEDRVRGGQQLALFNAYYHYIICHIEEKFCPNRARRFPNFGVWIAWWPDYRFDRIRSLSTRPRRSAPGRRRWRFFWTPAFVGLTV